MSYPYQQQQQQNYAQQGQYNPDQQKAGSQQPSPQSVMSNGAGPYSGPPVHFNFNGYGDATYTTPTSQNIKALNPTAPVKAPRSRSRNGSVSSRASSHHSNFSGYAGQSENILDDRAFAPAPKQPQSLENIKTQFIGLEKEALSTLPAYDQVKHSGTVMARYSLKSMLAKKWKPAFWIAYGDNQILFFRNYSDFEEWCSNPYLTKEERDGLVKLNLDFVNDLYKPNVVGYDITPMRTKVYSNHGLLYQSKVERWHSFGPTVLVCYAGKSEHEVFCLRKIMCAMIAKGPQRRKTPGIGDGGDSSSYYDSDARSAYTDSNTSARSLPNIGGKLFKRRGSKGSSHQAEQDAYQQSINGSSYEQEQKSRWEIFKKSGSKDHGAFQAEEKSRWERFKRNKNKDDSSRSLSTGSKQKRRGRKSKESSGRSDYETELMYAQFNREYYHSQSQDPMQNQQVQMNNQYQDPRYAQQQQQQQMNNQYNY